MKLGESSERLQYVVNPASTANSASGSATGGHYHYSHHSTSEGDLVLAKHTRTIEDDDNKRRSNSHVTQTKETIEFLVVNDDLILQRSRSNGLNNAVSQPDLAMGEKHKNVSLGSTGIPTYH